MKARRIARKNGVYVKAVLSTPGESVSVVIEGRHDEIREISRNGKTMVRASPDRQRPIRMAEIMKVVAKRDRRLEEIARDFIVRQVRGDPAKPLARRVAALVRERMCGAALPVMTVVGSGNHGLLLGVPFHELYRKQGTQILPAVLFSLLTVIHMTGKRSRISEECGLGTKAGPALAAGLAFARGADLAQIKESMRVVSNTLRSLTCHGARASCGRKAECVLRAVTTEGLL